MRDRREGEEGIGRDTEWGMGAVGTMTDRGEDKGRKHPLPYASRPVLKSRMLLAFLMIVLPVRGIS